jgi:hypothetical protein
MSCNTRRAVLALICAILLVPLALVDVPPLLDYPNHLARAFVLTFGAGDPIVSQMYAAHWAVIPNLATDLILPPLLLILPIHLAGRVVVALAILLPVIGTITYNRATFRTGSVWPLASALVAYNATLLLGFLNFAIGMGLALLYAAGWIAWRERYPRAVIALATLATSTLFFCHLMALVIFYVLIAGFELEQLWARRRHVKAIAARVIASAPMVVAPLALYQSSPLQSLAGRAWYVSLAEKGEQLLMPFANYSFPLDIFTACVVPVFLLVCFVKRRCRVTAASALTLLLTTLMFLATPWGFKGAYFLDTRFVIMLGFLVFAATLPINVPRSAAVAAAISFGLLFAIRMSVVGYAWYEHRDDLRDLRAVIALVEPGARVLVVAVEPQEAPAYWRSAPLSRQLSFGIGLELHMAALLLIERRAYWPLLFDYPAQQPVETLSPYLELAEHAGAVTSYRQLVTPAKVDLCGFDQVLLMDAGGEPDLANFAADRLSLVVRTDLAALFRIKPLACFPDSRPKSDNRP